MKWFARKAPSAALPGDVVSDAVSRRVEITVEREVRWMLRQTPDPGSADASPQRCPYCGQALPPAVSTDVAPPSRVTAID